MPVDAVLFDIDGTLIATGGAGAKSWRWAFEQLIGEPVDIGAFTDAGMTDPQVGRQSFERAVGRAPTSQEMARLIQLYLTVLPDQVQASEGYKVMPGAAELLPRLVDRHLLLGLTTGGLEAAGHVKLGRAGLNHFFTFGGYGSDSPDRAELTRRALARGGEILGHELRPERVLIVGDTPLDVKAAHDVGAPAVAVAAYHHTREQLEASGAEYVLDSLEEPFPGLD